METLASILPYLDPGDSTVSIDLLDTYLHVPSRSVKRLARLYIQRKRLSLQSTALRAQARTSPIHEASRMRGRFPPSAGVAEIFCYLDDWLMVANSPPSATAAPALLLQTVQALGFIINWDKSELTPTQCPNRATIDIPRQLARPSQRRIATLWRSARLLRGRRQLAPAKTWLQFRGFLSRLVDVRPDCRLLMRPLQLFFSGITNRAGTPYPDGSPCPDDPPPLPEVEPSGIPAHGQPIEGSQPTITVTTDASHTGWGSLPGPHCLWGLVPLQGTPPYQCAAVSGCLSVTPSLPPPCSAPHCTYPYGQRHSCCIHKQTRVHTHSACLNTLAAELWTWCRHRDFIPTAFYIPGQDNLIADFLSRGRVLPSEWTLHPQVMASILRTFGPLHVDLFASVLMPSSGDTARRLWTRQCGE